MAEHESDFGMESFTVRLWFRITDSSPVYRVSALIARFGVLGSFSLVLGVNGSPLVRQIKWSLVHGGSPDFTSIEMDDPTSGSVGPGTFLSTGVWHRTVVWYDREALEIGMQVDQETAVTAAIIQEVPAIPEPTASVFVGTTDNTPAVEFGALDEIGIWHRKVWTSTERNIDWDSGTGLSWPGVLAIKPHPMAYWRFDAGDEYDNTETFVNYGTLDPSIRIKGIRSMM